jgi:hypothetical protein
MVLGCATKNKITAESLLANPPSGGYTKVYPLSYDEAYQAVLDVCDDLDLVVEKEDKENKAIILWGDMDKKIDEELIGVYFDSYHAKRTAIRIITPSMKYKPHEWDDFIKADPWGLKIHTALKKKALAGIF